MELPIFTVDAFTNVPFKGNPAAVCLLPADSSLGQDATWMLHVAAEMNLAETAFLTPRAEGYELRWFTPTVEIPLCGHATLASAHVLWQTGQLKAAEVARFHTMSGWLTARRVGELIELDFPALHARPVELPPVVSAALGAPAQSAVLLSDASGNDRNFVVEYAAETTVRGLRPDFAALRQLPYGVIVTAQAEAGNVGGVGGLDFVSRYFAGAFGIDEDPVTGSAHCALTPYWSAKLGKTTMEAYQASPRGGRMQVELKGERVLMRGHAVTILRGVLLV